MAESSLSLGRVELRKAVARFMNWDPDEDDRTAAVNTRLTELVDSGLRQFYAAHDWQFMKIVYGGLDLAADDWQYDAPDDLAFIVGDITIDDQGEYHEPIHNRGEEFIRRRRQHNDTITGVPHWFGLAPKAFTGATGTRWEIQFYPTPNDAYAVTFAYGPQGTSPTASLPYPRGGARHAETIKASCVAIAELEMRNIAQGPRWGQWQQLLAQSIADDGRFQPRNFGYNSDRSERRHRDRHQFDWIAEPYP